MKSIIAADVGGTNCRLGLFKLDRGELELDRLAWISSAAIPHTGAFFECLERELTLTETIPDAIVTAIAGPVEEDTRGALTNGTLEIDFGPCRKKRPDAIFSVINDFTAQAYAVISPEGKRARQLAGPGQPRAHTVKSVLGAGTGFGQALLKKIVSGSHDQKSQWLPLSSENGHAAFPFINHHEQDFHSFLCSQLRIPYATGDDVLTGRGLACLHQYLTGEHLSAAEVGAAALGYQSETLSWYSRFYGRACRNWILATLCSGGLWIAGGIAAQNPCVVSNPHFFYELYFSPRWEKYLRTIPIYLLEDKNSGLWGAARLAQQLLENRQ